MQTPDVSPEATPRYQRVKTHVAALIGSGLLGPGDRVPSEHELVAQFKVSRMTANRALRELTAEGWLVRLPGLGSFVAPPRPRPVLLPIPDAAELAVAQGAVHRAEPILAGMEPGPPNVATLFGLPPGDMLFRQRWRHHAGNRPVSIEDRWLPADISPTIADPPTPASIIPYSERFDSLQAMLPPVDIAALLDLPDRLPCLFLCQVAKAGDRTISVGESWLSGDRVTLSGISRPSP
jgi:GntR family transcriptional regulator, histidine utilization repressor